MNKKKSTYRLYTSRKEIKIDLSSEMKGGEGSVFKLKGYKSWVVKVYHKPRKGQVQKLIRMLKCPPKDPMKHKNHHSIAWPRDLIINRKGEVVGFVMPFTEGSSVYSFLNPKRRKQHHPQSTYRTLIRICYNITAAIEGIHDAGHTISDINMNNILVKDNALVTLIDCDSFEIVDYKHKTVYPCRVGFPYYTPPEHQGKRYRAFKSGRWHDYFAMAVLFFELLMEGMHPFSGVNHKTRKTPKIEQNIANGHWPYDPARRHSIAPRPASPSFNFLHPSLQDLFVRCFRDGYKNPKLRPGLSSWKKNLKKIERELVQCSKNPSHTFWSHLTKCPWCLLSGYKETGLHRQNSTENKKKVISKKMFPSLKITPNILTKSLSKLKRNPTKLRSFEILYQKVNSLAKKHLVRLFKNKTQKLKKSLIQLNN